MATNPLVGQGASAPPSVAQFLTQAAGAGLNAQDLQALSQQNSLSGLVGAADQANPLVGAMISQELPAIEQYQQQYNAAEGQIGALGTQQGVQNQYLTSGEQLQSAQLQNQLQGNTLEQQNVAQQLGITNQQYGLQQQLAGIQQGQLNYNLPIAISQAQSQGAATGTIGTTGYEQRLGQLGEQYQVSSAELANQLAGQGLTNKGANLSATNQTAQLQNTAAALGISQQQLQNQLASGQYQLGLQTGQTGDQLLSQAAQATGGVAQGYGAILSNIGALTGLGPQAFSGTYPNLYSGG